MTNPFSTIDPDDVIGVVGDWHGNVSWAEKVIRWAGRHGVKTIIQAGDFGVWHGHKGKQYLDALDYRCKKSGVNVAFVPGNHENWSMLDSMALNAHGIGEVREHVFYLPRGFRWAMGGTSWLALGGATSVDKQWRTPHVDWFPREEITVAEAEATIAGGHADVMVTHDVPLGVPELEEFIRPNAQGWPRGVLHEAYAHRVLLRSVVDEVKPHRLFHGHYHWPYQDTLVLDDGHEVHVDGLGMDGVALHHNLALVDTAGLRVELPEVMG